MKVSVTVNPPPLASAGAFAKGNLTVPTYTVPEKWKELVM
jgi:hypothetical protein